MTQETYCFDCEETLTPENTQDYGGFDSGNYLAANTYGRMGKEYFTKCDSCFEADIDRHLDNQYN